MKVWQVRFGSKGYARAQHPMLPVILVLMKDDGTPPNYHSLCCHRHLDLSAWGYLTPIAVTCANILTSQRSSVGHPFTFKADANILLPLANFTEKATCSRYETFCWSEEQDLNLYLSTCCSRPRRSSDRSLLNQ